MYLYKNWLLFYCYHICLVVCLVWHQAVAAKEISGCNKMMPDWKTVTYKANDKCYVILPKRNSWSSSKRFCEGKGARLAQPDSALVDKSVQEVYREYVSRQHTEDNIKDCIHIGAHKTNEGWTWTDGSKLIYTNWEELSLDVLGTFKRCGSLDASRRGKEQPLKIVWMKRMCLTQECKEMCEYAADDPPLVTDRTTTEEYRESATIRGTTPQITVKSTRLLRNVMLSVPELMDKRLTYMPMWTEKSYSATMCGRMCEKYNCKTFNFCGATHECFGFDFHVSPPHSFEPNPGCGVWKNVIL